MKRTLLATIYFGLNPNTWTQVGNSHRIFNADKMDFSEIFSLVKELHKNITGKDVALRLLKTTEPDLYKIDYGSKYYSYFVRLVQE